MKTPSKKQCIEGAKLALNNSAALAKVGKGASKMGEYGACRSLMILSGEEAIKALWIICQSLFEIPLEGFDKVFKEHSFKHKLIRDMVPDIMEIMDGYQHMFDEFIKKFRSLRFPKPVALLTAHPRFEKEYKRLKRNTRDSISLQQAIEWWDKANNEKNNGFYVNVQGEKWHDPRSYTKTQASEAIKYTSVIYDSADIFIDDVLLLHDSISKTS